MRTGKFPSTFVNVLCSQENFRQLLTTFHAARRTSVKIRQLSNLSAILAAGRLFVKFLQLFVFPVDCLSTFRVDRRPSVTSVNFLCHRETFRHLPFTFCVARKPSVHTLCCRETFFETSRPSIKFHQFSMRLGHRPSTSINFPCYQKTLGQLSVRPGKLPSTFSVAWRPSSNFRQCSVRPGDHLSTSVNFSCSHDTFHQLTSTFCAARRPSVNFPYRRKTFRKLTSILCAARRPFINLLSTFRAAGRPFVNFCHLLVRLKDLS